MQGTTKRTGKNLEEDKVMIKHRIEKGAERKTGKGRIQNKEES